MDEITNDPQVVFYLIFTFTMIAGMVLMTSLFSAKETNIESKQESDNNNLEEECEEESEYENDSVDNTTTEDSEKSEMSEEMTSILYKSFSLLTKKQLLKITGKKYKYENKDILIVLAINKFIFKSIQNNEQLPSMVKKFVKQNKNQMLDETLKSYGLEMKHKVEEDCDCEQECE
jgi:hypothetical protein